LEYSGIVMGNVGIALFVVGALFTVYIVAATWRSRDAGSGVREKLQPRRSPSQTLDRRIVHWWRARQRKKRVQIP
jgi:hypothetical protein